ncbi:hypothetical protein [Mesorhizobium sp. B2-4-6]|uniref:hypothetical protein n=1 Tax=Mesorhizobium sp. B2-4-6 TaxID=2589943 RepID=UPI00112C00FB|nr:hypothetical protein [Mesorhizobium sp. B2-4-6]TPL40676.1 hypothetical protein FJ957_25945 [Mesorhizobium sp. B2-4-6]
MTDETRVEAIAIGSHYVAAYRRTGQPDQLLDGADGKPQRFASASDAIRAARGALVFRRPAEIVGDILGADRHHEVRAAREVELQLDTFGGVVIDGRVVPVEVRRK